MTRRDRVRRVVLRLLAAAAVGVATTGIAFVCAYFNQSGHSNYWDLQWSTRLTLDEIEKVIEAHRRASGRWPATLAEVDEVRSHSRFRAEGREVVDWWGNAYQYRVEDDRITLYSFGRDGRPGGDGLDADIYPTSTGRSSSQPTLRQFAFDLPTGGIWSACGLAGVCAALVCLLPSRNLSRAEFLARVAATAVGAVVAAVAISYLHIPSGH